MKTRSVKKCGTSVILNHTILLECTSKSHSIHHDGRSSHSFRFPNDKYGYEFEVRFRAVKGETINVNPPDRRINGKET